MNTTSTPATDTAPAGDRTPDAIDTIRTALRGMRFGTVTLVVHDGVVVQVERTEKVRLDRGGTKRGSS